jgi:hypothetical protein
MAEAAIMTPETAVFPLSETSPGTRSEPNKGGRPKGYKPFNNEVTAEEFFALLNEIPDAEWPKSLVYVWRRDPFTDNTNGGREPKYIDVINRSVTELNIKEEHGSGSYKLQLNTNDKYIAHTILSLEDPKFPPHVPPGDWFNHPRNKKWVSWKPLVEKWWRERLADAAGTQPGTNHEGPALQQLAALVSQLAQSSKAETDPITKTLIAWALQQTAEQKKADREDIKAERDAESPGKIAELIRAVKELMPAPPAKSSEPDPMMTFVLGQLTRLQESNDKLVQAMLSRKDEQANPLSQVETMAKLMTTVSGLVQPAAPKEWYQELATELGPKVVDLTTQLIMLNAMNGRRPPMPPAATNQPQPMRQQPNPAQVVTLAPQPQATAESQPVVPPAPVTNEPELDTMQRSLLIQIAQLATQALNLGLEGSLFAEQICTSIFNDRAYDDFCAMVPKEELIPKFRSVPEAWQWLQPHESLLPRFIDSFYAYGESEPEEIAKSVSQPVPVDVKPQKKGKKK